MKEVNFIDFYSIWVLRGDHVHRSTEQRQWNRSGGRNNRLRQEPDVSHRDSVFYFDRALKRQRHKYNILRLFLVIYEFSIITPRKAS